MVIKRYSVLMLSFTYLILILPFTCFGEESSGEHCISGTCSNQEIQLRSLQRDIFDLVEKKHCNPILVRLAWHDAGTYDASVGDKQWPKCGGANGVSKIHCRDVESKILIRRVHKIST